MIPTNPHEPYIQNPRDPQLDSLTLDERLNINWGDISYFDIDSETQDTSWYSYSETSMTVLCLGLINS